MLLARRKSLSSRCDMKVQFDQDDLRPLIREVMAEVLATCDWPQGRIALTEAEAASACGVNRHVLRDLRLAGKIMGRRLGKKVVYTRSDLLAALQALTGESHHQSTGTNTRGVRNVG